MDSFCGSRFWDSKRTWDTDSPSLTPCFERTAVLLLPCVFLWVFTVPDIYWSYCSPARNIPWSPLNISKLVVTSVLMVLEMVILIQARVVIPVNNRKYKSYPVDVFVPLIRATTLLLFSALLLYSKSKGVRSSGVQFIFWLLMTLMQIVRFATVTEHIDSVGQPRHSKDIIQDSIVFILEVMYFPLVTSQFILHWWADVAPKYQPQDEVIQQNVCPEYSCSFPSRILFHWFTPLAWTGFRKPLEYSDLWNLNWYNLSKNVVPKFDHHWPRDLNKGRQRKCHEVMHHFNGYRKYQTKGKSVDKRVKFVSQKYSVEERKSKKFSKNQEFGVFTTLVKTFGWDYLYGFVLRTTTDLMMFISPYILHLLIDFMGSDQPTWKGILYAVILFTCAFISTLFNTNGVHKFYMTGMRAKTCLLSAVYRKSLLLSNTARRTESLGEIVNHMSVDVTYATEFAQYGYQLWGTPIIISCALYFLWKILGPSAVAGLVVMVLLLPLNALIASKIQKLQVEQMKNKDKRTKLMNEILAGIKVLKLNAWETSFEKQVMKIRKEELRILKSLAWLNSLSNCIWATAPVLVGTFTFGVFVLVDKKNVLDAKKAFVSLALFQALTQPFTFLPLLMSGYIQASVAIKRLNKFLNADEIDTDAVSHDEFERYPVVITNGNFCWEENSETLKDINLRVRDEELVAIVGTVGSGKSSLLSVLLNELIKVSGRVNIRGKVANVSQQAWIQNASVRDNILFGMPFELTKYEKVIDACALRPDLETFPAKDKTEIGEKGINLSGGQKQRIALARAVYSNADVYLLDDPLSAVDAHVGRHIFDKVLGPRGILRKKTRLLVTHGVVYLPYMDNIVVMRNGHISEQGNYQQLMAKKGAFAEFLEQHMTSEEPEGIEMNIDEKILEAAAIQDELRYRRENGDVVQYYYQSESELSETESSGRPRSFLSLNEEGGIAVGPESDGAMELLPGDKLIEVEKAETESVRASVYLDYLRAAGWCLTFVTVGLFFIFQGFSVGANLWLSHWTRLPVVNGTQDTNERNFHLGVYSGLGFLQGVMILIATLVIALGTLKSANVLHNEMLQRVMRAPLSFFDVTPIGRFVNRFSRDIDSLDNVLPMYLRFLLNGIFNVLAVLVVISISTPVFTVVVIPIGLLYYFVQRFYVATSRQLKRLESVTRTPIFSHFGESVSGATTIRAYDQQERFILELEKRVDHNLMSCFSSLCANRWLQVRLETVGNTIVFFAALFAVLGKGRESLDQGLAGLSVSYALQITLSLVLLVRFTSEVETNIVAVERIKEYSKCPQEAGCNSAEGETSPPKEWPQHGAIKFVEYETRYRPGLEMVLKNVGCEIKAGEKIGIVGRTGAGKSTLALALFRIIEAAGGKIEVDGQDISKLGLNDLRGRITIIPQDPVLFSGSLRINLDPFEQKEDGVLWRALELAHLKGFVDTLPGGLDYEIAEGGENLSVGQRQLVCLARALLRKTKILVLDEATAAVDLDTDDLIHETIRSEFKESTVITIAHRLNTIMDSNRVIVLDKGEILEFDSPQNLLADETTTFYSMAKEAGTVVPTSN